MNGSNVTLNGFEDVLSFVQDREIYTAAYAKCQIVKRNMEDTQVQQILGEVSKRYPNLKQATEEDKIVSYIFSLMINPDDLSQFKPSSTQIEKDPEKNWQLLCDVYFRGHTFKLGDQTIVLPADLNKGKLFLNMGATYRSTYCLNRLKELAEEANKPTTPLIIIPTITTTPTSKMPITSTSTTTTTPTSNIATTSTSNGSKITIRLPNQVVTNLTEKKTNNLNPQKTKKQDRFYASPEDDLIVMSAYTLKNELMSLYNERQRSDMILLAKSRYATSSKISREDKFIQEIFKGVMAAFRFRRIKTRVSETNSNTTITRDNAFKHLETAFSNGHTFGQKKLKFVMASDSAFALRLKNLKDNPPIITNEGSSFQSEEVFSQDLEIFDRDEMNNIQEPSISPSNTTTNNILQESSRSPTSPTQNNNIVNNIQGVAKNPTTTTSTVTNETPNHKRKRVEERKPPESKDRVNNRIIIRLLQVVDNDLSQIDFSVVANSKDNKLIKEAKGSFYRYLFDSYKSFSSKSEVLKEPLFDFVEDQVNDGFDFDWEQVAAFLSTKTKTVSAKQAELDWLLKAWDLISIVHPIDGSQSQL